MHFSGHPRSCARQPVPCQEPLLSALVPRVPQGNCRVSLGLAPLAAPYLQACWAREIKAGAPPSPGTALLSAAFETDFRAGCSVTTHLNCPRCAYLCALGRVIPAATPVSPSCSPGAALLPPLPPPQCDMLAVHTQLQPGSIYPELLCSPLLGSCDT